MSSRTKDAIIAAIATVLAAVIGAAGLIIANERRDAQSLRLEIERLEADRAAKEKELANILGQLNRVKQERNLAQQQPQEERPKSSELSQVLEDTSNLPVVLTERERDFTFGLQACQRSGSVTACY